MIGTFQIKYITASKAVEYFKISRWKRFWKRLRGLVPNQRWTFFMTVEVDSLRKVKKGDVFIASGNTGWKIINTSIVNLPPAVPRLFVECRSIKAYTHNQIIGPAVIVGRSIEEKLTKPQADA